MFAPDSEYYFTAVSWISLTEVCIVWLNRPQNLSLVTVCKSPMWHCQEVSVRASCFIHATSKIYKPSAVFYTLLYVLSTLLNKPADFFISRYTYIHILFNKILFRFNRALFIFLYLVTEYVIRKLQLRYRLQFCSMFGCM